MRQIDELIKDISLCEEDYLHIEEISLSQEEYERIRKITTEKIRRVQEMDEKVEISKKKIKVRKSSLKKTTKILIIAAVLMASGTTLIAAIGNGTIEEIFRIVLGENTLNIGTSGVLLEAKETEEGIILNVEGAIADKHTINVLANLEKENGESFEGNNIKFDKLTLEMEGEEVSNIGGLVSWWQYDIIETLDKQPSKLKLQLKTGDIKGIEGKKATLTMENIIEYNSYDILTQVNLAEHLNDKSEDLAKEVIPNQDRRYNEKLIALGDEQEIAFKESIPRYLLPSKGLNRQLFSERPEVKLDNIGFIDGQLHIKIKGADSNLVLKDENEKIVEPTYRVSSDNKNDYYVYPIANREELRKTSCWMTINKEIRKTEGIWQVSFDVNSQSEVKTVKLDRQIPLTNVGTIGVAEIELSNLSIAVTYKEDERVIKYPDVSILFEDGTKSLVSYKEVYLSVKEGKLRQCIYDFDKPIDIAAVKAVMINDSLIPIK